jgi:hypothetical protein
MLSELYYSTNGPRLSNADTSSSSYSWKFLSDGWLLNRNEGLLLFITPERSGYFINPKLLSVTRQNTLSGVDWGKLCVGDKWVMCYCDIWLDHYRPFSLVFLSLVNLVIFQSTKIPRNLQLFALSTAIAPGGFGYTVAALHNHLHQTQVENWCS